MINLNYSGNTGSIREFFKDARKMISISIGVLFLVSMVYLFYWGAVETSDIVYQYTGHIMAPLAQALFPQNHTNMIFRDTSFFLLMTIFPLFLAYYVCNKAEELLLKAMYATDDVVKNYAAKKEAKKIAKAYNAIDRYAICLSLDYVGGANLTEQIKSMLNKSIYAKLKSALSKVNSEIVTISNDIMITISSNFENYDEIYGRIIISLAKIKKAVEAAYKIEIVPSLTTDAFCGNIDIRKIQKSHNEIKSLILSNRASSTALFQKKYNYLKRNKYSGIPIGEYTSPDKNSTESYELNIIYRNLSDILAGLA